MKKIWAAMCLPFVVVVALIPYAVAVAIMHLSVEEGIRVFKEQF